MMRSRRTTTRPGTTSLARRRRYSRDPLGLRRALSGWLLPGLVAAMALLAALAVAGAASSAIAATSPGSSQPESARRSPSGSRE